MSRRNLRGLALGACAALLLGASDAAAKTFEIPMRDVSARPRPVRLAAGDPVGRMVFARYYRPTFDDAISGRMSIFREEQNLPLEDWLRAWGAVQIQQIGRPY